MWLQMDMPTRTRHYHNPHTSHLSWLHGFSELIIGTYASLKKDTEALQDASMHDSMSHQTNRSCETTILAFSGTVNTLLVCTRPPGQYSQSQHNSARLSLETLLAEGYACYSMSARLVMINASLSKYMNKAMCGKAFSFWTIVISPFPSSHLGSLVERFFVKAWRRPGST